MAALVGLTVGFGYGQYRAIRLVRQQVTLVNKAIKIIEVRDADLAYDDDAVDWSKLDVCR
jgi:hypothetical protein